ncbi:MAG TPA: F0F1 ATP synthase subunit B [Beijerinckiaceae bacterium]|jgi:F-type H+-transporting ATPase subunit b|nr:F0F1 ATP synthase subunit B [Beijerinckiaceae bacterium]
MSDEIWIAIAFVLVVIVAWRPLKARLQSMLDERAVQIGKELDAAQRLREEAERTLADYQQKQRDALAQAEEILAHAKVEAKAIGERAKRDLAAAIERRRKMATDRIALEEQKAVADVRNLAVDIAVAASRHILAQNLDDNRRGALVDQAIADLPRQLQH